MVRIGDQFPDDISDSVIYNLEDQIGSSSMRLNTLGAVIDKEECCPFGDSSLRTFSKKRYRYVGKEKDLESGLYYYGARYYAAWTCRFISVDPLAADYAHLTPYNNAGNKVINTVDIDGMQGGNEDKTPDSGGDTQGEDIDLSDVENPPEYYMNKKGFFIEGDENFGEYVGNVKPTDKRYYELEKIKGKYYHKNTNNIYSSAGNWVNDLFGGDPDYFVEKKPQVETPCSST